MKSLVVGLLIAALCYVSFEASKFSSVVRVVNADRIERASNY